MAGLTLEKHVQSLKNESTSDDELKAAVNGDLDVILYTELRHLKHIREAFEKSKNVVILFPTTAENVGHYIALLYYPEFNAVSVFDPYGYSLMEDIKLATYLRFVDNRTREALPALLKSSGMQVQINRIRLQSLDDSIRTCGRHVVTRIKFRQIYSHDEYAKFLSYKKLSPDEIVSLIFI